MSYTSHVIYVQYCVSDFCLSEKYFNYIETCLNWTLNITNSCINQSLNKFPMYQHFANLTCIIQIPVNSKHKSLSQGGSVYYGKSFYFQWEANICLVLD